MKNKNISIKQDQITEDIRVSTAAIWYNVYNEWGLTPYYQYETWCFSNDSKQRTFQVIHGTSSYPDNYYKDKAIKIHRYIVNNLKGHDNQAPS